ncbi:MAG: hypothetical protein QOE71_1591 [Pseudonocardiales bacterium]|nr:hypothetical protein [Pseudonocardiales bacterium]
MADEYGVLATQLTNDELERQGVQAHATRHWAFLHGTAEQFRTHTQRMLELEQEYLRRHPQRTWQGSGRTEPETAASIVRDARIRDLVRTLSTEVLSLLDERIPPRPTDPEARDEPVAQARLLAAFAATPGGSLHKLEAHQIARSVAPNARLVASMYKHDPPLLRADGDQRVITDAGRAWLFERGSR